MAADDESIEYREELGRVEQEGDSIQEERDSFFRIIEELRQDVADLEGRNGRQHRQLVGERGRVARRDSEIRNLRAEVTSLSAEVTRLLVELHGLTRQVTPTRRQDDNDHGGGGGGGDGDGVAVGGGGGQ